MCIRLGSVLESLLHLCSDMYILHSTYTHFLEHQITVYSGKLDFVWLEKKDNLMLLN